MRFSLFSLKQCIIKQLLDSVFVIYGRIDCKGFGKCNQPQPSIIANITKTSSNNCLLGLCRAQNPTVPVGNELYTTAFYL